MKKTISAALIFLFTLIDPAHAWFDETHIAIAKAAGCKKWYNAAAADIAKIKLGKREGLNHYHNSPKGVEITAEMVLKQADMYDKKDQDGHLYGAIIGSFRAYLSAKRKGRYAEGDMAYLVHYLGDLSMPLHHTLYNGFNRKNHSANDGIIDDEVLENINKIVTYEITIKTEADLAKEVARIANLSKRLGHTLEDQNRHMTREEAYRQTGHSVSLLKAVLEMTKY
jgi:hypothetical protein